MALVENHICHIQHSNISYISVFRRGTVYFIQLLVVCVRVSITIPYCYRVIVSAIGTVAKENEISSCRMFNIWDNCPGSDPVVKCFLIAFCSLCAVSGNV